MLITMADHQLDPNEQQQDTRAPGLVGIRSVRVTRGRSSPPGTWVEDSEIGSVVVELVPPADDRTPADRMGYRIRLAGGNAPGAAMIPPQDVRAIAFSDGVPFLVFYWNDGATDSHPPMRLILSIAAVDLAGNVGPRRYVAACDPAVAMPGPDELPYDPAALRVVDEGASGWLLSDGRSRMVMLASEEDARNALAVVQRNSRQGFVGRDNRRPNRGDYIFHYWTGRSGVSPKPLTKTDLLPFDPANLFAHDLGARGFRIQDGSHAMLLADDAGDAAAMMQQMQPYRRMGFIGRDNTRPDRKRYIMTYWE